LNSSYANHRALALAAKAATVDQAFLLALGRRPNAQEAKLAGAFVRQREAYYRQHSPPPDAPQKPLVRAITSELTGTAVQVEEDQPMVAYEEDRKPMQPEVRALADLALSLFNTNEFVYVY
jgi:hypothetical protein